MSLIRNGLLIKSCKISFTCGILHRRISNSMICCGKNYFKREVKMMGKLLSPTRKKRKLIFDDISSPSLKGPKFNHLSGGKETSRRIAVLNSLFVRQISDLMMTGNFSANVLDKGLEITRVSIAPSFSELYVYWTANSEENISLLEQVLPTIGFELRHELSQLQVMGFVPRINFLKDKHVSDAMKVDYLLSLADYGEDHISPPLGSEFKEPALPHTEVVKVKSSSSDSEDDVTQHEVEACEEEIPVMRHDVFNLDHKAIMDRIMKAMTKSRALHRFQPNLALDCKGTELPSTPSDMTAEYMEKSERKEALNRFILSRKILKHKKLQNKYKSDLHPSKYEESGIKDDEFENYFEEEDYLKENDYPEDHDYKKSY